MKTKEDITYIKMMAELALPHVIRANPSWMASMVVEESYRIAEAMNARFDKLVKDNGHA